MRLELTVDHRDLEPGELLNRLILAFGNKPNNPATLAASPFFSSRLATWTTLALYSVTLRNFRLYCFINSRTQLQVTVEPTGNILVAAQSAWDGIRWALRGAHASLTSAEAIDTPSGLVVMSAQVSVVRELGQLAVISTVAIGVVTIFWVAIGSATFASGHALDMVVAPYLDGWLPL